MTTTPNHRPSTLARRLAATEPVYDYTHYPYEPVLDPRGKWSSSFLLETALDSTDTRGLHDVFESVQTVLGVDATVWGVKQLNDDAYAWELYFYDYSRNDARFNATHILEVVGRASDELFPPSVDRCPRRPFMFSLDIAPDQRVLTSVGGFHFYFYNVGERMTGLSYGFTAGEWTLENHYAFYDPFEDKAQLWEKITDSPHLGPGVAVQTEFVTDLLRCRRVCVANKPKSDGIYFGGVSVHQLIRFLEYFGYEPKLVSVVRSNATDLDHLLYDVAFDYGTNANGAVHVVKTAFYGTV